MRRCRVRWHDRGSYTASWARRHINWWYFVRIGSPGSNVTRSNRQINFRRAPFDADDPRSSNERRLRYEMPHLPCPFCPLRRGEPTADPRSRAFRRAAAPSLPCDRPGCGDLSHQDSAFRCEALRVSLRGPGCRPPASGNSAYLRGALRVSPWGRPQAAGEALGFDLALVLILTWAKSHARQETGGAHAEHAPVLDDFEVVLAVTNLRGRRSACGSALPRPPRTPGLTNANPQRTCPALGPCRPRRSAESPAGRTQARR